jgi:hypothetical protein
MKAQTFLLISIPICLILALIATSASYFYYTIEPFIVEAHVAYRGWPLYWMIDPSSYYRRPPYNLTSMFQPLNFSLDVAFWMTIFQTSVLLYAYLRKRAQLQN